MYPDFKELLSAFNAGDVRYLIVGDFVDTDSFLRMGTPPAMVDILPRIKGVEFGKAWERRVLRAIEPDLTVPFISRDDLLAAKLAAGRPEDLADVAALESAAEQDRQS